MTARVGKIIFLKLETRDCWGFPFFRLADCPEKNDFWAGKIIFAKLESGDCWDFFFCGVHCFLGRGGGSMIFGSRKSFLRNWRVAIAGIWWDFFFCGVHCFFGEGRGGGKKNDFWVGKIIFAKLESGDSLLFLAGEGGGKKMIFGSGKSIFRNWRMAMADLLGLHRLRRLFCCWARRVPGNSPFAVSTAAWQIAGQKKIRVGKIVFLRLETSDCSDLLGFFFLCLLLLGHCSPL